MDIGHVELRSDRDLAPEQARGVADQFARTLAGVLGPRGHTLAIERLVIDAPHAQLHSQAGLTTLAVSVAAQITAQLRGD